MLYPIDGWTIGTSFVPRSIDQCRPYGDKVAQRFRSLPNIVWMSGGDYFLATKDLARGTDLDHCIDAMMRGIRETGDHRPFSMELGSRSRSPPETRSGRARRLELRLHLLPDVPRGARATPASPPIPALMGESNYEGENN